MESDYRWNYVDYFVTACILAVVVGIFTGGIGILTIACLWWYAFMVYA